MSRIIPLLVFVWSTAAFAQRLAPIPGEERFPALKSDKTSNAVMIPLAFRTIGEDSFITIAPRMELGFGDFGLGLQVPLAIRVIDKDPKATNDYLGRIRREDWDEVQDYFKIIRYARYGNKRGPVYVRVGELAASIGHGTIMRGYMNNLDFDTFRVGAQVDVNTDYWGVETILGDIGNIADTGSVDSRIVGARAYVKPLAFAYEPDSPLNILAVGLSMITDINAPRLVGLPDADGNPTVPDKGAATVIGFDIEVQALDNNIVKLVPYLDTNFITKAGWGLHLGVMSELYTPIAGLSFLARAEYRRFRDYVPSYFGELYEIERFNYLGADNLGLTGFDQPKFGQLDVSSTGGINGYYLDAATNFFGFAQLGMNFEDYSTGAPNAAAFLLVPALETIQFKAYYSKSSLQDFNDFFKLDNRSFAVAQARVQMSTFTFLTARATRRWRLDPITNTFVGTNSWDAGVEFAVTF